MVYGPLSTSREGVGQALGQCQQQILPGRAEVGFTAACFLVIPAGDMGSDLDRYRVHSLC